MSDFLKYVGSTAGAVTLGAVTATAAAWYVMSRPNAIEPRFDLNNQSKPYPGVPGGRLSPLADDDGTCLERLHDDVHTYVDIIKRGAKISNNGPCAGWREGNGPYVWISYNDVFEKALNAGSGFIKKGLKPINSTRVGIYTQNRVEYLVTELACYSYSMAIVPLYDTLGPEACTYIINQADIELVVCDKPNCVKKLLDHKKNTPRLRVIVHVEVVPEEEVKRAKSLGVDLIRFADLEKLGADNPQEPKPAKAEDLCVICYTSGTTGKPKGAMMTHRNIVACVSAIDLHLSFLRVGPEDVMISYLPLAHMYERICELFVYLNGGHMGFYRGDVKLLMDDIATLKPTLFPSVPRLLNRVYDKVTATVSSSRIKKALFDYAVASKMSEVQRGIIRRDSIWDKLVFSKVQQSLGGRVRFIVSGSAPLAPRVLNFLRAATGAVVLEGYGQTECSAVCSIQLDGEGDAGHVGTPLACCAIKLVDVREMDYLLSNNQGEICVRGANVISGYLNMPEKTAEAIDKDGWLHTGDVGEWLPNGSLKIIDRKKNIFKLAQGEYISPEKIENVYTRSRAVAQIFVHGESLKACLLGVVVLDPDTVHKWVKEELNITGATMKELCANKDVKKAVLDDLTKVGKAAGLHSFEQVKDIYLYGEQFSVENGLLTPTFKAKRHELAKYFSKQIVAMYSKLD